MLKAITNWKVFMFVHIVVSIGVSVILLQISLIPKPYSLLMVGLIFIMNIFVYRILYKTKFYNMFETSKKDMMNCFVTLSTVILATFGIFLERSHLYIENNTYINDDNRISIITLKQGGKDTIKDLSHSLVYIGPYEDAESIYTITNELGEYDSTIKIMRVYNYDEFVNDLYNGSAQALVVNESQLSYINEMYSSFIENTQVIGSYHIEGELPLVACLVSGLN